MSKLRQLTRLLNLMLLAGMPHIATATANCPNGNIQSIDLKGFKSVFTQRYCINPNKASCIRKWNNFTELLDRIVSDDRSRHIPIASFLLATAYVETYNGDFSASTKEIKGKINENRAYWKYDPDTHSQYFGRGWLQLTWKDKYIRASKELGRDLVRNPDLTLEPDVAFEILLLGLTQGWLETYRSTPNGGAGNIPISVNDFLLKEPPDYSSARAAINANCIGKCSPNDRIKINGKGYIPTPNKIDAAKKTELEAKFFERTLCRFGTTS